MSIPYKIKEKFINLLFNYEESNHIPDDERWTLDAYKNNPLIDEISPRKKPYVDIRRLIGYVKNLMRGGAIK